MTDPIRRLVLVRHGATDWSEQRRHTGRTDVSLIEAGEQGAREVGDRLRALASALGPYERVRCSPLQRARLTCELAGFGEAAAYDDDLMEWDYGQMEGRRTVEIREEIPGWTLWKEGPIGGETIEDVAARARHFIERTIDAEGATLVFAHGHFLRILATQWIGVAPAQAQLLMLDPSTISTLSFDRVVQVIERWNG